MPGSTALGIRYPLGTESPQVAPDMQRLAGDVDGLLQGPYGHVGLDANQGPVGTTGAVFVGAWVSRFTRGVNANANGLVVLTAGWYEITAWARFQIAATANNPRLIIGNGASAVIGEAYGLGPHTATFNQSLYITRVAALGAGEQIRCGFFQTVASTITMVGGAALTGLTARLIAKT